MLEELGQTVSRSMAMTGRILRHDGIWVTPCGAGWGAADDRQASAELCVRSQLLCAGAGLQSRTSNEIEIHLGECTR